MNCLLLLVFQLIGDVPVFRTFVFLSKFETKLD